MKLSVGSSKSRCNELRTEVYHPRQRDSFPPIQLSLSVHVATLPKRDSKSVRALHTDDDERRAN